MLSMTIKCSCIIDAQHAFVAELIRHCDYTAQHINNMNSSLNPLNAQEH